MGAVTRVILAILRKALKVALRLQSAPTPAPKKRENINERNKKNDDERRLLSAGTHSNILSSCFASRKKIGSFAQRQSIESSDSKV